MQLEAPVVWKVGIGVALAGTLAWYATSREEPAALVPQIELVQELEPTASDGVALTPLDADRGAIARVEQLLALLPDRSAIDTVSVDADQTADLGFDLERRQLTFRGGNGACVVSLMIDRGLVIDRGAVVRADAACWFSREDWDKVRLFVQHRVQAAQLHVTADANVVRLRRTAVYPRFAAARVRLDVELGPLSEVHGTLEELAAYETLAGIGELTFGHSCGITGAATEGARAVRALMGREDLLRNVLHGINPEGRAFAAEALEQLGKLRHDDREAMRTLAKLPLRIQRCGGCMMSDEASSEVFAQR